MSWKSSLTGALLVVIAGLAVGVAIGGKKTTHIVTVTRHNTDTKTITLTTTLPAKTTTVTTTATAPVATTPVTTPAGGTTSTPVSTAPGNSSRQYYADYVSTQTTGNNAEQADLDSDPTSLELNGNTYPHAIAFDLQPGGCCSQPTDSYQLPIPGFSSFRSALAGLVTSDSASASYKLTIYKNNDNPGAVVLYSNTFTGPSGVHPVSFSTQGATDLLLVWTNTTYDKANDDQDTFVFADPVVTTGK